MTADSPTFGGDAIVARGPASVVRDERWKIVEGRIMFARTWSLPDPAAPTVVLIPGLVVASDSSVPTAERLAQRFRVIAPDPPGCGRSERPPEALPVPETARALIEWMAAMGLWRVMVVANSFGCQLAAEMAMRRPDLVERLVLASPTLDPAARTMPALLVRWARELMTQSFELQKLLVRAYWRTGVRRAIRMVRQLLRDRIEEKLPFVASPTLIVRGTADPIVSQSWAEEVASLIPGARLDTLPRIPHAMSFEAPDEFTRAIIPFLSGSATTSAG